MYYWVLETIERTLARTQSWDVRLLDSSEQGVPPERIQENSDKSLTYKKCGQLGSQRLCFGIISNLRVSCCHSWIRYCGFPTNKDVLLQNQHAALKIGKYVTAILYSDLIQVFPVVYLISVIQRNPAQNHALHPRVSFVCQSGRGPQFPWLTLSKITAQLFCRMFLHWFCVMFPQDYVQVIHLWQEYHKTDAVFSSHPLRWHMVLICSIQVHVNFENLNRVVSARLLHHKLPFFFIISKY